jgi:hypothetical protein
MTPWPDRPCATVRKRVHGGLFGLVFVVGTRKPLDRSWVFRNGVHDQINSQASVKKGRIPNFRADCGRCLTAMLARELGVSTSSGCVASRSGWPRRRQCRSYKAFASMGCWRRTPRYGRWWCQRSRPLGSTWPLKLQPPPSARPRPPGHGHTASAGHCCSRGSPASRCNAARPAAPRSSRPST